MAPRTSVTIVLLAILAGAWVFEAAAQDPVQVAAKKHKSVLKHSSKPDKYEKHGKSYDKPHEYDEKHYGEEYKEHHYKGEGPYHGDDYYKGDSYKGDSYKGDYYKGEGPYYGEGRKYYEGHSEGPYYGEDSKYYEGGEYYEGYSGPETGPDGKHYPKYLDIELQLGQEYKDCDAWSTCFDDGSRRLQRAPRKVDPAPAGGKTTIKSIFEYGYFDEQVNVFCPKEESYGYKHTEDSTPVSIAKYRTHFTHADLGKTKCYGKEADIVGTLQGTLGDITDDADECIECLKEGWKLKTDGKIARFPALLKLSKAVIASTASATYGEYYDDKDHSVCGYAYMFNGTAAYGTDAFFTYADAIVAGNTATPQTTPPAYWGYARYIAGFNGANEDQTYCVELPFHWCPGPGSCQNCPSNLGVNWDELKAICKTKRNSLVTVEYGEFEANLHRFTWEEAAKRIKNGP